MNATTGNATASGYQSGCRGKFQARPRSVAEQLQQGAKRRTTRAACRHDRCGLITIGLRERKDRGCKVRWPRNFEQGVKWNLGLKAGMLCLRIRSDDEEATPPEPHTDLQGE